MPRDPRADPLIERAKLRCPGCRIAWRLDGWKHRSPANSECIAKEERAELRQIAAECREKERMAYEQDVKDLAYTLDPPCWVSYSGKGRNFKAAMDYRRNASLRKAQDTMDRIRERRGPQASIEDRIEALEAQIVELKRERRLQSSIV